MTTLSRIEVVDSGQDKPYLKLTVPGEVVKEQIKKEIKVSVTLSVDVGDKKKRTTAQIKILDEDLKNQLIEYLDDLIVRIYKVSTDENVSNEFKLKDLKPEES